MLHPVLSVCAVAAIGSLITIGIAAMTDNRPTDARGNLLPPLNPQEVAESADKPIEPTRMITCL